MTASSYRQGLFVLVTVFVFANNASAQSAEVVVGGAIGPLQACVRTVSPTGPPGAQAAHAILVFPQAGGQVTVSEVHGGAASPAAIRCVRQELGRVVSPPYSGNVMRMECRIPLVAGPTLTCGAPGTVPTHPGSAPVAAPQPAPPRAAPPAGGVENTAPACRDNIDNDGDGRSDCQDQDCWDFTFCAAARQPAPAPVAAPRSPGPRGRPGPAALPGRQHDRGINAALAQLESGRDPLEVYREYELQIGHTFFGGLRVMRGDFTAELGSFGSGYETLFEGSENALATMRRYRGVDVFGFVFGMIGLSLLIAEAGIAVADSELLMYDTGIPGEEETHLTGAFWGLLIPGTLALIIGLLMDPIANTLLTRAVHRFNEDLYAEIRDRSQ